MVDAEVGEHEKIIVPGWDVYKHPTEIEKGKVETPLSSRGAGKANVVVGVTHPTDCGRNATTNHGSLGGALGTACGETRPFDCPPEYDPNPITTGHKLREKFV